MTKRELEVLDFITDHINQHHIPPSFDEIRAALGFSSKSGIHRIMKSLEAQGRIRRMFNKARAIELVEDPVFPTLTHFSVADLATEAQRRGLVLGHIVQDVKHHLDGTTERRRTFRKIEV